MASKRGEAFEAFYESLSDKGGIGGRELLRKAWDAGRKYEEQHVDAIARPNKENKRLLRALSDIQFDLINCSEAAGSRSCEHLKDAIRQVNKALKPYPPVK
jgi:hypothetical protein